MQLSDLCFEHLYLKVIILWMWKTIAFTRWCNTVKHLVFPGLVLSAYNSFLEEKEKIFLLLPDVKWQWLWPGYLELQKLQIICTSIKMNHPKCIWLGEQRRHVTLSEFCVGCPDKLGAGVPFIQIKLTQAWCTNEEVKLVCQ